MALEEEWERRLDADHRSHLKLVAGIAFGVVAIVLAALLWFMSR
jgi:hypothetical protein